MSRGLLGRIMNLRARWAPGALALCFLLQPRFSEALDASLLTGVTDSVDTDETSYAWQLDFRKNFETPFAVSASWINEGHFRGHHRDGLAGQFWGHIPVLNDKISFAFGGGAYRYFDTRPGTNGGHENAHGWAPILSLSVFWYSETPWFVRLSANHIHPAGNIDTNSLLLGLGYRLGHESPETTRGRRSAGTSPPPNTGAELTPFLGVAIRNSLESRAGLAAGVEYRRGLSRNFDWTLSLLNEDNEKGIRRGGIGSQMWLVDSFVRRRGVLGLGGGLYTYYDRNPPPDKHSAIDIAGLITLTAGYRLSGPWIARLNWNRVVTANDRDSDVVVLGFGYRRGE